jgi:uncharacterized membrane protein YbhN (UPF0104 family)
VRRERAVVITTSLGVSASSRMLRGGRGRQLVVSCLVSLAGPSHVAIVPLRRVRWFRTRTGAMALEVLHQLDFRGLATKLLRPKLLLNSIPASLLVFLLSFFVFLLFSSFVSFYHVIFFYLGPRGECGGLKLEDKSEREDIRKVRWN